MASQFDDSDFIDRDYQGSQASYSAAPGHHGAPSGTRAPTQQQLDSRVGDAQRKLAELKRAQEELERERAALEEARRRRLEFQTGREEMLQHLTKGVALMEKAEFTARRDAEQMARTLGGLREALDSVQGIREEHWTPEDWNTQLTKALSSIENARMEWSQARLRWTLLDGGDTAAESGDAAPRAVLWQEYSFWQLCKVGAAMTWPVALAVLIGVILLLVFQS